MDTVKTTRKSSRDSGEKPWHSYITIDLVLAAAQCSILHPYVAWMVPLGLRAQVMQFDDPIMRYAILYASVLTVIFILVRLDRRLASGKPRKVDLDEEVIVITGGASGLGLLLAEIYSLRGASVALLDIQKPQKGLGESVEFYECDVGNEEQVKKTFQQIKKDFDAPASILINNAGIVNGKLLKDLSSAEIERTFRVNLLAHFWTTRACLPDMIAEERGTIVTISSVLGYLGCQRLADYSASKAGLIAFHASLTAELASSPSIKTVLVTPGQLTTTLFEGVQTPSNFLGPLVEPVQVAKEIVKAVDEGISIELAMPLYSKWIQVMGILPPGLKWLARKASGLDNAMDTYVSK